MSSQKKQDFFFPICEFRLRFHAMQKRGKGKETYDTEKKEEEEENVEKEMEKKSFVG